MEQREPVARFRHPVEVEALRQHHQKLARRRPRQTALQRRTPDRIQQAHLRRRRRFLPLGAAPAHEVVLQPRVCGGREPPGPDLRHAEGIAVGAVERHLRHLSAAAPDRDDGPDGQRIERQGRTALQPLNPAQPGDQHTRRLRVQPIERENILQRLRDAHHVHHVREQRRAPVFRQDGDDARGVLDRGFGERHRTHRLARVERHTPAAGRRLRRRAGQVAAGVGDRILRRVVRVKQACQPLGPLRLEQRKIFARAGQRRRDTRRPRQQRHIDHLDRLSPCPRAQGVGRVEPARLTSAIPVRQAQGQRVAPQAGQRGAVGHKGGVRRRPLDLHHVRAVIVDHGHDVILAGDESEPACDEQRHDCDPTRCQADTCEHPATPAGPRLAGRGREAGLDLQRTNG